VLTEFISKSFVNEGMDRIEIKDEWSHRETLFRNPNKNPSFFILLRVGRDFRDPDWSVELCVGQGFPEEADDPVEFYLSTVSLSELGVFDKRIVNYLPLEISEIDLKDVLKDGVSYCVNFVDSDFENAIAERNKRNRSQLADPIGLDSEENKELYKDDPEKHQLFKSDLSGRHEELRELLKKYL
jgi:hypothetical protein